MSTGVPARRGCAEWTRISPTSIVDVSTTHIHKHQCNAVIMCFFLVLLCRLVYSYACTCACPLFDHTSTSYPPIQTLLPLMAVDRRRMHACVCALAIRALAESCGKAWRLSRQAEIDILGTCVRCPSEPPHTHTPTFPLILGIHLCKRTLGARPARLIDIWHGRIAHHRRTHRRSLTVDGDAHLNLSVRF